MDFVQVYANIFLDHNNTDIESKESSENLTEYDNFFQILPNPEKNI